MDAAGGDVRGDERLGLAGVEGLHVAGASTLTEVAVELDGGYAALVQLAGERLGAVLGPGEHDDAAGRAGQVDQDRDAVLAVDVQDVVAHRRDRRLHRVGLVGHRVVQELLDEGVDRPVERGREEQPLTALRGPAEQAAYGREEAEVSHVVGLVEHGDLDIVQRAVALADQVLETSGAGDDDVDALAERSHLRVLPHPTEDGARGEPGGRSERRQRGIDLADQLAGRRQDQGAGCPRTGGRAVDQTRDDREQEGVGLAGARAAAAEHVAPGQGVGQGGGLDRGRDVDALAGEDGGQARGHAERFERSQRGRYLCGASPTAVIRRFRAATHGAVGDCYDVRTTRGENSTS